MLVSEYSRLGQEAAPPPKPQAAVSAIIRRGSTPVKDVVVEAFDSVSGGRLTDPMKTGADGMVMFPIDIPGRKIVLRPTPPAGFAFDQSEKLATSLPIEYSDAKFRWGPEKSIPFAMVNEPGVFTKLGNWFNPWTLAFVAGGGFIAWNYLRRKE